MSEWLLTHHVNLQWWVWVCSFGLVAVWESFRPRRALATPTPSRWLRNVSLAMLSTLLAQICLPLAAISVAIIAEQEAWGLFNRVSLPPWLSCALAVLIIDLSAYWVHRLFHSVPLFWRFHKVHHSELDVDCSTAARHHPFEFLAVSAVVLLVIATIGASPLAVLISIVLGSVAAMFNHGNLAIPVSLDRILRLILVTPDMHRVHHSAVHLESNHNFGNLFPWWDHLFLTYQAQPHAGHEAMEIGIAEICTVEEVRLWKLLLLPFRVPRGVDPTHVTLARGSR
jgi:sterol desaturase/sphingolipid hydroxylase (fatty acid hydroxylase superfamily)